MEKIRAKVIDEKIISGVILDKQIIILFLDLGDSGGALYVKETINNVTKFVASGIVSYGYGCAHKNIPRYQYKHY